MNRLSDNINALIAGQTTTLSDGGLTSEMVDLSDQDIAMFIAEIQPNNQPQALLTAILFAAIDETGGDREDILTIPGIEPIDFGDPLRRYRICLETKSEDLPSGKNWVGCEIIETAGLPNEATISILAATANKRKRYSNVLGADRRIATFPD